MSIAACPGCAVGAAPAPAPVRRADQATKAIRLSVPDMRCASCISDVERIVAAAPGVSRVCAP